MSKRPSKPLSDISDRHKRRLISEQCQNEGISNIQETFSSVEETAGAACYSSDLPSAFSKDSDSKSSSNSPVNEDNQTPFNYLLEGITESDLEYMEPNSSSSNEDGDDSSDISDSVETTRSELEDWASKGVNHSKVNDLLKILQKHKCFSTLPKDVRTLLHTPRETRTKSVGNGTYCHLGIAENLRFLLEHFPEIQQYELLRLIVNFDGLPLAKSSGSQTWPVLLSLFDHPSIEPFVAGVYHGYSKPESPHQYLEDYVQEVTQLQSEGLFFNEKLYIVQVIGYVCDAPALAFIAQTKGHAGTYSCHKCTVSGETVEHRMVFNEYDAPLRTNEDFASKAQEEHHIGDSPLLQIPGTKMVTSLLLDYMHLVCLGVVRKMLTAFIKGNLNVRQKNDVIEAISHRLVNIRSSIPMEFARKPRSLKELPRWKATELRQFLLYTGPLVLNGYLSRSVFKHFLSFHYAIRILVSTQYIQSNIDYAKDLLYYFVSNFKNIYGNESTTYNVHGLLHLADDAKEYGVLDLFSAFRFENKLQALKKMVRKHEKPLQQIVRRISEQKITAPIVTTINQMEPSFIPMKNTIYSLPQNLSNPCFSAIQFAHFKITSMSPDNCVILKTGDICLINCIATKDLEVSCLAQKFLTVEEYYSSPTTSTEIGIYRASKLSKEAVWPISYIKCKAILIPLESNPNEYYVAEILHH